MDGIVDRLAATPTTALLTAAHAMPSPGSSREVRWRRERGAPRPNAMPQTSKPEVPRSLEMSKAISSQAMVRTRRAALLVLPWRADPRLRGRWRLIAAMGFLVAAQLALVPRWGDGLLGSPRYAAIASPIARFAR